MKKILCLLLVFLVSSTALAQDPALPAKAKAEGEVNFYANITAIEPIVEAFSQDTGVKGLYTRVSTSKYLATVLSEFQAGKLMADVLRAPLPIMNYLKE
ncbi:MAG: hypothetical protein WHS86_08040 [Desulfosoma sp.]